MMPAPRARPEPFEGPDLRTRRIEYGDRPDEVVVYDASHEGGVRAGANIVVPADALVDLAEMA